MLKRAVAFVVALVCDALLCGCGGRTPLNGAMDETPSRQPGPVPPASPGVPPDPTGLCPIGKDLCGAAPLCFDLQTSPANCGVCGKRCPLGIPCVSGRCDVYSCRGMVTMKALSPWSGGGTMIEMSLGDLDGDGFLDLVGTRSSGPAMASTFLGKGDGTFVAKTPLPSALGQVWLSWYSAVADLNQDGVLDVVATSPHADSVTVRLGVGDGNLRDGIDYVMDAGPAGILLADVNGDGKTDLVTAAQKGQAVSIRFGMGDGTFGELGTIPVAGFPRVVIGTDWNGDGTPDLVANDDFLHVLLGLGRGAFSPIDCGISVSSGQMGNGVVADFDQDGRVDLAVGSGVLFGMDGCNFTSHFDHSRWWPLVADDFNGDGLPDLAAASDGDWLGVFAADSTAGFIEQPVHIDLPSQADYYAAVSGDLNGDGRIDLVLAGYSETRVLLNTCK